MTDPSLLTYHHAQKGPWFVLLYVLTAAFLAASWHLPVFALRITFFVTGLLMLLLGVSFHYLAIDDEGNQLGIRFGPFPLFRKWIFYDDILGVEAGRTTFLDGWGIHWSPWGGWVWNIWGRDCVVLRLKRGTLKVGTDDPQGLADFLKDRISCPR